MVMVFERSTICLSLELDFYGVTNSCGELIRLINDYRWLKWSVSKVKYLLDIFEDDG